MNSAYPDGERRLYERLKVNITVVYQVDKPIKVKMLVGKEEVEAPMLDLSEGGISILTEYNIPAYTRLSIKFMLYRLEKATNFKLYESLRVKGEVKYSFASEGNKYRLGVCFKDLDYGSKSIIAEFVKVANIPPKIEDIS
jgi:c-di-GMP-binding flagellar brake protein YcgR